MLVIDEIVVGGVGGIVEGIAGEYVAGRIGHLAVGSLGLRCVAPPAPSILKGKDFRQDEPICQEKVHT